MAEISSLLTLQGQLALLTLIGFFFFFFSIDVVIT